MPLLPLLKQAWEHRALILAVSIAFLVAICLRQREALTRRPAVETRVETRVETKVVRGPERIVEKLVKGKIVERVVYRDPVVIKTVKERESERSEKPVCLAPRTRYAGVGVDMFNTGWKQPDLRAGLTVFELLDLGGRVNPWRRVVGVEAAYRW